MTELGLILGINLAGFAFAMALARWVAGSDSSRTEIRRLQGAVERACRSLLADIYRSVGLTIALLAALLAGLRLMVKPSTNPLLSPVLLATLGVVLGGLLTCLVTYFGVRLSQRANVRTMAALRTGVDTALGVTTRAGGAIGLVAESVATLGAWLMFGALWLFRTPDSEAHLLVEAVHLVAAYALGTAAASLVIQRVGSVYQCATDAGAGQTLVVEAKLERNDPRNPAAVAELVGIHVGPVASRTVDLFLCSSIAGAATLAASSSHPDHEAKGAALALLALPLMVKTFGVLASGFGIMVIRTEENGDASLALWRGHLTTLLITLGGVLGSTVWLLGKSWPPFFMAGCLGVIVAGATAHWGRRTLLRRVSPMRDALDALRLGGEAVVSHGLASGLKAAVAPALGALVALVVAWQLGMASEVPGGGSLAVQVALMAMLAAGPYMLGTSVLGPLVEGTRGFATLTGSLDDELLRRRAGRLRETGIDSDTFSQGFWIFVGAVAALLTQSALLSWPFGAPSDAAAKAIDVAHPAVAYAGLLGAAVVVAYAGTVLRSAARSARGVVLEVERQLGGFPRERGRLQVPADYIPSYRSLIEIAGKGALDRGLLLSVAAALLTPIALAFSLAETLTSSTVAAALSAFVLAGAAAGLVAAFATGTNRVMLAALRRQAQAKPELAGSAEYANRLAEMLGNSVTPSALLAFKTAALASLVATPFIS